MENRRDMMANCEEYAKEIDAVLPPEIGCVIIIYNKLTGDVAMKAPRAARKVTDEIFKSLTARPDRNQIIISPKTFRT